MKKSQAERVHDILKQGKTVTSWDGRIDGRAAYGILDIPKRISELRQRHGVKYVLDDWKTVTDRHGNTTRVKVYRLNVGNEQQELIPKKEKRCTAWD